MMIRAFPNSFRYILQKECFDTRIVYDGESALKEFEDYNPDLVLLDLMLPGIDGYDVCRKIRKKA